MLLSNFAFNFNLRSYSMEDEVRQYLAEHRMDFAEVAAGAYTRPLLSST